MIRKFLYILSFIFMITPLQAKTILVLGDSLSAAYGIEENQGWVSLLKERLKEESLPYQVVNYSTSGDTTRNGLAKLPEALSKHKPDIVIIELGANDGLRGLSIPELKRNLEKLIVQSQDRSAKVLLLATLLPPNYGASYLAKYKQVYVDLSQQYQTLLIPMFLEGVAGNPTWMQSDGLHPNQKAQVKILNNIWPVLKQML
ncbi:Esterase TesA precursor [Legionella beliardensis]|uniref:Esterase TesA n=1 Tax=Legionella beliardensis TaxID=91822 RepID=A0A378HYD0_9GAMM|nr:arylesterase [Legionella beliardensis]STX27561.1 Esterase TesA precursor [Legionella beliardensis]